MLKQLEIPIQICDPNVQSEISGVSLTPFHQLQKASILIMAVPHDTFLEKKTQDFLDILDDDNGIVMDLKGVIPTNINFKNHLIWRL